MSPRVQKGLYNIASMPNPVKGPDSVGNYAVNPSVLACVEVRNGNKKLDTEQLLGSNGLSKPTTEAAHSAGIINWRIRLTTKGWQWHFRCPRTCPGRCCRPGGMTKDIPELTKAHASCEGLASRCLTWKCWNEITIDQRRVQGSGRVKIPRVMLPY